MLIKPRKLTKPVRLRKFRELEDHFPRVSKQEAAAGEEDSLSGEAPYGQAESQGCIFHELPLNYSCSFS